jgi:hypothetical protein
MEPLKVIAALGCISSAFFLVLWYREGLKHDKTKIKFERARTAADTIGSALVAAMWDRFGTRNMELVVPGHKMEDLLKEGNLTVQCFMLPFGCFKITVSKPDSGGAQ